MKIPQKIISIFILIISCEMTNASNDTTKVNLFVNADIVNHYVWRGLMLGNSVAIQPSMGINAGNFSFGSWASYSFNPSSFQEVDLFLTWSIKNFTFGITDYYNPTDSLWKSDTWLDLNRSTTLHTIESSVSWSSPSGFSALVSVFVFGNDRDENDSNYFSNYLEMSYGTSIGQNDLSFFAGATLSKGYYSDHAALVNLGTSIGRNLRFNNNFSIPVKGSFIVNPDKQNVFLVLVFTF